MALSFWLSGPAWYNSIHNIYLFSGAETKKDIQTQTYIEEIDEGIDHDIQIIEREDSNNVSIQINIKPKPKMTNNCCLTDVNGIEPQRSFSVENLRTGKFNLMIRHACH